MHRVIKVTDTVSATDCTSKVPLGEVAKAVGEKWRNLSDENKEKYKAAAIAKVAWASDKFVQKRYGHLFVALGTDFQVMQQGKELQETADTAEDGGDETETPSAATKTSAITHTTEVPGIQCQITFEKKSSRVGQIYCTLHHLLHHTVEAGRQQLLQYDLLGMKI